MGAAGQSLERPGQSIIQEYLRLAPGARPHMGLGPRASLAGYTRVAPRCPVFRIVYLGAPARP